MAKTKAARPDARPYLSSFNPSTGKVMGEIPANTPEEVREAVARARRAQPAWADLGAEGRVKALREVRLRIGELMDDIVETVSAENGKPPAEALAHDVLPTVLTLRFFEWLAPRALRPKRVGRVLGPVFGLSTKIEWRPFGVVGSITPWNYPFFLAFMAFAPALFAGNAVVVKPSEVTPSVGERIRECLEVLPEGVATVVQGAGEVGAALVDAPCDKICFIGSTDTGRRIAEAAARHLTPVVMELGGQDAAIVCGDADLDVASSGILWGAFLNTGQTCCAIERVYVPETVADEFEQQLAGKLSKLQPGRDVGPLTAARQFEVVDRHVKDAVDKGAKALSGGPGAATPRGDGSLWYPLTVLEGRTEDMAIYREETFGPVLPIVRVRDEEEALRRANEDGYNLTASVWSGDRRRAEALASKLRAGNVTINDHAVTAGVPWGVWGGVGESGYGRLNGELGLREFTVPVAVGKNLTPKLKRMWWYPYDQSTTETLRSLTELVAAGTLGQRAAALKSLAGGYLKAIRGKI